MVLRSARIVGNHNDNGDKRGRKSAVERGFGAGMRGGERKYSQCADNQGKDIRKRRRALLYRKRRQAPQNKAEYQEKG